MNQEQKKYFLKRVRQIASEKIESSTVDVMPFILKLKIRNHKSFILKINYNKAVNNIIDNCFRDVRLPNDNDYSPPIRLPETIYFENYEQIKDEYKEECNRVNNIARERNAKINKYADQLGDKLVLGDAEEALKGLEKFQSMKF